MREYVTLYKIHKTHDHVKYKLPVEYREEIVRCRDCKHGYKNVCERPIWDDGERACAPIEPDGFCAWGEELDKVAENFKETVELMDGLGNVVYSYDRDLGKGFDPVECPEHYCSGTLECIDWIRAMLTEEEFKGYLKGNALKYIWRYDQKDKENPKQDLKKAVWYLNKLCEVMVL